MARPNPCAPPVTMAFFPSSEKFISLKIAIQKFRLQRNSFPIRSQNGAQPCRQKKSPRTSLDVLNRPAKNPFQTARQAFGHVVAVSAGRFVKGASPDMVADGFV